MKGCRAFLADRVRAGCFTARLIQQDKACLTFSGQRPGDAQLCLLLIGALCIDKNAVLREMQGVGEGEKYPACHAGTREPA